MKCIGYAPEGAIKQDLHQADTVVKEFSNKLIEYNYGKISKKLDSVLVKKSAVYFFIKTFS